MFPHIKLLRSFAELSAILMNFFSHTFDCASKLSLRSGPIKPLPGADTILSAYKFLHCLDDEPRSWVTSALGKICPAAVVTPTILTLSSSE